MNKNIILAGVGGQGILTLAAIIDHAAMEKGLNIKQAEVHGMSQRGGAVQSHLRISDNEIFSDLIPLGKADIILALEPLEVLRYIPFLSDDGIIITALEPVINIDNYPDVEQIQKKINDCGNKCVFVNAKELAKEAGNTKAENVVMVGVISKYIGIDKTQFESSLKDMFASKGEDVIAINIKAFNLGYNLTI
ncbi:MAG: indolepyruvate oxidoreductase subunit beta [Bacteroidales bacterium]|nr:indolepyruvate oxidoreductase subunit beta [Bacteroidales bacterium]